MGALMAVIAWAFVVTTLAVLLFAAFRAFGGGHRPQH